MHQNLARATLFEVSWEVCNKVGGIYAVVSSKALQAASVFGERYYLLGPDLGENPEFEESNDHSWDLLKQATSLRNLNCRFGRWKIPGKPKAILVNFKDRYTQGQLLYEMWNRYGVDSLTGSWDYVEPVMFSTACGEVIAAAYQALVEPVKAPAVAHFHEWMCGAGLLTVKRLAPQVGTIFTTHATMLGRALAGSGWDIYTDSRKINPLREANAHNITAKCSMERTSAREADCFTTVSRITADEATVTLGHTPQIITPNGLDLRVIPDYSENRAWPLAQRARLLSAVERLQRRPVPENTRIMVISGRYEYHNKGVDIFLDSLAGVNEALSSSPSHVLAICAVMGGHSGVDEDAVSGDPNRKPEGGEHWISSHHVYDRAHDPIISTCLRLGLDNRPENHVQVVFIPALLDGNDGFLNMTYDEMLGACDLGVFPSWYEPWGYTPQESAAWGVPTVTTDLSGFGLWVREQSTALHVNEGVTILPRRETSYEDTEAALRKSLLSFATMNADELRLQRVQARAVTTGCTWEKFFPHYGQAYTYALERAASRGTSPVDEQSKVLSRVLTGTSSSTPVLHSFMAVAQLPVAIERLRELAFNLWWCWEPAARRLFAAIDPAAWTECGHNPVEVLERVSSARLLELANDQDFLDRYHSVMQAFDAYMAVPQTDLGEDFNKDRPLAYFSTEYGMSECLPIYSGGLGVLSGDHMKSTSDLKVPLVGMGLLYKSGYFVQELDREGRQVATYPDSDFSTMPLERVVDANGDPLDIAVDLPGRQLHAQVWVVHVGRAKLYLLDTDTPKNTADDRKTTARLYEADRDCRIRQEILLGMGGVRALQALNITPCAFHMNEGHSAFLIFERIRVLMLEKGLSFDAAREVVRGSCLFTTHTPVDAGNERFTIDLMEKYFSTFAQSVGVAWQDFLRLGKLDRTDRNMFEMTVLALNHCHRSNGVSRLHGEVSRYMWQDGWKGVPRAEVPIGHVTNGVHVASYAGPAIRPLLEECLGKGWEDFDAADPAWNKVSNLPLRRMWEARRSQKSALLSEIARKLPMQFEKYDVPRSAQREILARLNPDALVIGFARRFAPYKRSNLLFADLDRLERLLNDSGHPVIFVFSGKAHPADTHGIDIMQEVVRYTTDPRFRGRVFFLENYNLRSSRLLVQGCDVWLNTPRRPHEASGTSGMKVSVNGGLNLSIADGWWCEGYDGENGWTIGPVMTTLKAADQQNDYADAESLYTLLEESVVPLYYSRDEEGLPRDWLLRARRAMQTLTLQYSSHRMVSDYLRDYYVPASKRYAALRANSFALPTTIADWKKNVSSRFTTVRVEEVLLTGLDGDTLICGQPMQVSVTLTPGEMVKDELLVQLVAGPSDSGADFDTLPAVVELKVQEETADHKLVYTGEYVPGGNGYYAYGVRVVPTHVCMDSPLDTKLVVWA